MSSSSTTANAAASTAATTLGVPVPTVSSQDQVSITSDLTNTNSNLTNTNSNGTATTVATTTTGSLLDDHTVTNTEPAAIRTANVGNMTLTLGPRTESLAEMATRSFTAGSDIAMELRNGIKSLVKTAAHAIRLSRAANGADRMPHHVQLIQSNVAYWQGIMGEESDNSVAPIDGETIEMAINETMELLENTD
jgi:hypothetical protein